MKSAFIHVFLLFQIFKAETVSVMERASVTLHTGVTEIQREDVIEWKLNGYRIAKISGDPSRTDGVFRDRLKLDYQTGDLTITNIPSTESGEYILKITSNRGSSEKIISVNVNPVCVTGMPVWLGHDPTVSSLLLSTTVTDPRSDGVTVVAVTEGDSVVLHTDTEILEDDEILWRFREEYVIVKMKKDEYFFSTYFDGESILHLNQVDIANGIFRDRLHLDHQTGNIIISDITFKTSGLYEVDVKKKSTYTIHKAFNVTVTDRQNKLNRVSVKEGVPVILASGVTELYEDNLVQWRFEHGDVLAKINKTAGIFSTYDDVPDGRFRGRLKLDKQTGSLNITHTKTSDSGLYDLDITGDRHVILRKFILSVSGSGDVTWIVAVVLGVLLVAAVACGIYYRYRRSKLVTHSDMKCAEEVYLHKLPI